MITVEQLQDFLQAQGWAVPDGHHRMVVLLNMKGSVSFTSIQGETIVIYKNGGELTLTTPAPAAVTAWEPHVQRMINEHEELHHRAGSLAVFIVQGRKDVNAQFNKLAREDQVLMELQLDAMQMYLRVLTARLQRAGYTPEQ